MSSPQPHDITIRVTPPSDHIYRSTRPQRLGASSVSLMELGNVGGIQSALSSMEAIRSDDNRASDSITYLDDLRRQHDLLATDLDHATETYIAISQRRDTNGDPGQEDSLNRHFLAANNRLSRARREYDAHLDEINELREISRMIRLRQTYNDLGTSRSSGTSATTASEETARVRQDQLEALERERNELITQPRAIDTLTEHAAYVEHLNKSLSETVQARDQRVAAMTTDLKEMKEKNLDLELEAEDVSERVQRAEKEVEGLTGVLRGLKRANEGLRSECAEIGEYARGLEEKLEDSTAMVDRLLIDAVANVRPRALEGKAYSL